MLDGFVGTIPCAEHKFAWFVIVCEDVFTLHGFGNGYASESQGACSNINMFHQIITHFVGSNLGAVNHEGYMNAFFVKELFAPCMADAMISPEKEDGVIVDIFVFESLDELA